MYVSCLLSGVEVKGGGISGTVVVGSGFSEKPLKRGLSKRCGSLLLGAAVVTVAVAAVEGCEVPNEISKKLLSKGSDPLVVMTLKGTHCC